MHCVDIGESFPTKFCLQQLASIQPRTRPFKFARSTCKDTQGSIVSRQGYSSFTSSNDHARDVEKSSKCQVMLTELSGEVHTSPHHIGKLQDDVEVLVLREM